jgi:hypothetical protein
LDSDALSRKIAKLDVGLVGGGNYRGLKPEDLPNMKPALRKKYGEWLESQKA